MIFRTDLALEEKESLSDSSEDIWQETEELENCRITRMKVSASAAARLHKPAGTYITLELPAISDHIDGDNRYILCTAKELHRLLPENGLVLVAGIGNRSITPDALGPAAAEQILATRCIQGEIARVTGLEGLRPVASVSTGVLGNTGFESAELLAGLILELQPAAVIAIDALAARDLSRLGCTVQLSDTGIHPGSGVHNARKGLTRDTLGVPVIGIGVPTVVDAATLALDLMSSPRDGWEEKISPRGAKMVVTPREIDLLVARAARLIAMAINLALNPRFTVEELDALASH